jgi:site-specific DNA-methyltransferase (adenine-specific)
MPSYIPIVCTDNCLPIMLYAGDCLPIMRSFREDNSYNAIITDPPYGLSDISSADTIQAITAWASSDREHVPDGKGFMGNEWDRFVPPPAVWDECYRLLKPGGYMAVFAGNRTVDLMGLSIRLAGFEMRDTITWMYGSGFPKSLDIGKAIDKAAGAERKVVGRAQRPDGSSRDAAVGGASETSLIGSVNGTLNTNSAVSVISLPETETAKQWDGWGTALKPAGEPIIVARKPFPGTVAANVLTHGTGGMNIDGCRVAMTDVDRAVVDKRSGAGFNAQVYSKNMGRSGGKFTSASAGRWPANVVLSHTEWCSETECTDGCPIAELDAQSGLSNSPGTYKRTTVVKNHVYGASNDRPVQYGHGDSGGASRFFNIFRYQAKAPKSERPVINGKSHPTVKPQALIEWLITLFVAEGGLLIDPFAGSGTTGAAAKKLGHPAVLIEKETKYQPHIHQKLGITSEEVAS